MKDNVTLQEKLLHQLHMTNILMARAHHEEHTKRRAAKLKEFKELHEQGSESTENAQVMWVKKTAATQDCKSQCNEFSGHKKDGLEMHNRGQHRLLLILLVGDGVAQKDLVEKMDIRPTSLGELIDKLETKGYVSRQVNEEDKRSVQIFLTNEGKTKAQEIVERREKSAEKIFAGLNGQEQEQLWTLLKKLTASLKEELSKNNDREHSCCYHKNR
ncbi:MAG: MarR family transcriptional regulator [Chloroflexi bacterium]|nr:MarR family transcriptional regulator [Chloroflexota bacterium]